MPDVHVDVLNRSIETTCLLEMISWKLEMFANPAGNFWENRGVQKTPSDDQSKKAPGQDGPNSLRYAREYMERKGGFWITAFWEVR